MMLRSSMTCSSANKMQTRHRIQSATCLDYISMHHAPNVPPKKQLCQRHDQSCVVRTARVLFGYITGTMTQTRGANIAKSTSINMIGCIADAMKKSARHIGAAKMASVRLLGCKMKPGLTFGMHVHYNCVCRYDTIKTTAKPVKIGTWNQRSRTEFNSLPYCNRPGGLIFAYFTNMPQCLGPDLDSFPNLSGGMPEPALMRPIPVLENPWSGRTNHTCSFQSRADITTSEPTEILHADAKTISSKKLHVLRPAILAKNMMP